MSDLIAEAPTTEPQPNGVEVGTVQVTIGPTSPIDTTTDNGKTEEAVSVLKEKQMKKEAFLTERAFVGKFALQILDKAQLPDTDNTPENQAALQALKEKLQTMPSNLTLSQAEMAILTKLNFAYPPALTDQDPTATNVSTQANLTTLLTGYYGEQPGLVLADQEADTVQMTETEGLQKAAQALGLLTVESEIDDQHWLCQAMSAAYRGLLTPQEIAQHLQFLGPKDRLLITPDDLLPEGEFGQYFLDQNRAANLGHQNETNPFQSISHELTRELTGIPVLRIILQEKLNSKITMIRAQATEHIQALRRNYSDQTQLAEKINQITQQADEQIQQLEADFYGLHDPQQLHERAKNLLTSFHQFYGNLTEQEASLQSSWLTLLNPSGANEQEKTQAKMGAIAALMPVFGLEDTYRFEPDKLEALGVDIAKISGKIGLLALIIVLMQIYTGLSSNPEGGGGSVGH